MRCGRRHLTREVAVADLLALQNPDEPSATKASFSIKYLNHHIPLLEARVRLHRAHIQTLQHLQIDGRMFELCKLPPTDDGDGQVDLATYLTEPQKVRARHQGLLVLNVLQSLHEIDTASLEMHREDLANNGVAMCEPCPVRTRLDCADEALRAYGLQERYTARTVAGWVAEFLSTIALRRDTRGRTRRTTAGASVVI
ncbi:hypothetical protein SDRG_05249 [Saprolegnia diclina VS20]|uniref:Uncharacterized protein n=1 Tax=Saprolegnia diclina (strain VS20) TaxID=1156394 RepID=T0QSH9_SAPDV|nr:hypothetical protein SDRG_05249 [Saprolegnia diclina VS20]EQC37661.1 hypothetical protein SDRG_05249 [Saprolegnia diclina VS20]|eukprot:XP_008609181.1 hypothetical protein SDRG_05249 [Saprolegnia diclina VS20]